MESNGGVGNLGIETGTGSLEEFSSLVVSLSTAFINLPLEDIDEGIMNALLS